MRFTPKRPAFLLYPAYCILFSALIVFIAHPLTPSELPGREVKINSRAQQWVPVSFDFQVVATNTAARVYLHDPRCGDFEVTEDYTESPPWIAESSATASCDGLSAAAHATAEPQLLKGSGSCSGALAGGDRTVSSLASAWGGARLNTNAKQISVSWNVDIQGPTEYENVFLGIYTATNEITFRSNSGNELVPIEEPCGGYWMLFVCETNTGYDVTYTGTIEVKELIDDNAQGNICCECNQLGGSEDNKNADFEEEDSCGGPGMPRISVNTVNLNMVIEDTDLSYTGRGPDIEITRTHNANDPNNSIFGHGWSFNYNIRLQESLDGSVYLRRGSAKIDHFLSDGSGGYTPPEGVDDILTKNGDGTWSLRIKNDKTTQNFDTSGRLTSIADRNGNTVTFQYGEPIGLTSITDATSRITTFTYDVDGRVISITDPAGRTATYSYDIIGNLISTTDMEGNIVRYTYDEVEGYITEIETPKGITRLTYTPSPFGGYALESITNPDGVTKNYGTTPGNPLQVEIEDGEGHKTSYDNNDPGYTERITDALGNQLNYGYTNGKRTSITDANGNTTSIAYDSRGNVTSITTPLGRTIRYEYDSNDNLTKVTDPRGNIVIFTYDGNDNLTSISNPPTTFTYNGYGELASVTDARGNTTTFNYDSDGNLASITNARGETPYTFGYDGVGRLTQVTDRQGNTTTYQYDAIDRVIQTNFPIGIRQFVYECCGLQSETDEEGKTTQYAYKPTDGLTAQNLRTVTDAMKPVPGVTTYEYDNAGNMRQVTDARGNSMLYSYDNADRLVQHGDGTIYTYYPAGNIKTKTDLNGNTINYTYDNDNRLITITYPDTSQVTFTYDNNSNVTSMTDANGATTCTYSFIAGSDRLVSKTDPYGKTIQYGYDAVGNPTSVTYPDGKVVSYGYDELNRLTTVTDWLGNTTTYTYAFENYLESITYPNGVITSYGYDGRWRLTSMVTRKSNGTVISSYIYTMDGVGDRTGVDKVEPTSGIPSLGSITYNYDTDNRLISATGAYSATFDYDNNGNLISKDASGAITTYDYDFEDRLTSSSDDSGNTTQYTYDGLGNRIVRTVNGGITRYVVDTNSALSRILTETDDLGNITAYYVHGLGLLARITPAGSAYYYHHDGIGSTIAMTNSSQNIVNRYAYDPYGKILTSVEGVSNPFKFVGQFGVMDEGNGLYFMRARYYDAGIKRFLQKDPLWGDKREPGSFNRYLYVQNDPVGRIDPIGLRDYSLVYVHGIHGDIEDAEKKVRKARLNPDLLIAPYGKKGGVKEALAAHCFGTGPALREKIWEPLKNSYVRHVVCFSGGCPAFLAASRAYNIRYGNMTSYGSTTGPGGGTIIGGEISHGVALDILVGLVPRVVSLGPPGKEKQMLGIKFLFPF